MAYLDWKVTKHCGTYMLHASPNQLYCDSYTVLSIGILIEKHGLYFYSSSDSNAKFIIFQIEIITMIPFYIIDLRCNMMPTIINNITIKRIINNITIKRNRTFLSELNAFGTAFKRFWKHFLPRSKSWLIH